MSLWRKIKSIITPETEKGEQDENEMDLVVFKAKDPIDVIFTKNFVSGGGLFFYCEDEQDALANLKEIVENESITEAICFNEKLKSFFNRLNVKHHPDFSHQHEFAFIDCEYLVAFDGSIMLSSQQTKGRKQEDLPNNIIIYATTNQFAENINEALQKLKLNKGNVISTTTSIRGKNIHDVDASTTAKKIYLLLVEE